MRPGLSARATFALAVSLTIMLAGSVRGQAADWRWSPASPAPQARTEVSVAADERYIYLLGGFAPAQAASDQASAPREVFRYEPGSDQWTAMPPLPFGLNHAGLVFLGGRLIIAGAYLEATFQPTGAVWVLDLGGEGWRPARPMPTRRGALALAVLDGRVHAIGGHDGKSTVAVHEIYDPASDTWTSAAPLQAARNHHAAATIGGEIYVFGGRDEQTSTMTSTEIYDPVANSWRFGAPLPTGRSGIAAAVLDGMAAVFGGEAFRGGKPGTFDNVELYDPAGNSWTALPDMPTPRHGLGAAAVEGRFFVMSGGPQPGFTYSDANEVLQPAPGDRLR